MKEKEINLKLRMQVLEIALELETTITDLIKTYFSISKDKLKALSHKSGNLSFKNKIDLLFDFEILNDNEYKSLIHMMEFRNQFMHNSDCNSFAKAIEILGADRGKYLLSFVSEEKSDLETAYLIGYKKCFLNVMNFLLEKFIKNKDNVQFKIDLIRSYEMKVDLMKKTLFQTVFNIIEFAENYLKSVNIDPLIINKITNGMVDVAKDTKVEDPNTKFINLDFEAMKILFDKKPSWKPKTPFPSINQTNINTEDSA